MHVYFKYYYGTGHHQNNNWFPGKFQGTEALERLTSVILKKVIHEHETKRMSKTSSV